MGNWTFEEWDVAVKAYFEMQKQLQNNDGFNKLELYRQLNQNYPSRTVKAWEYRMQNISAVLDEMGWPWITGLKPARNVGAKSKLMAIEAIKVNSLRGWLEQCGQNKDPVTFLCKRLSGTDTGQNGNHQSGIYLNRNVLKILPQILQSQQSDPDLHLELTIHSHPSISPHLHKRNVRVVWYKSKKNELRMTQFGGRKSPLQKSENTNRICIMYFSETPNGIQCHCWMSTTQAEDEEIERRFGVLEEGMCYNFSTNKSQSSSTKKDAPMTNENALNNTETYPGRFYTQWIKGSKGTVRKPFQVDTGRPLGTTVETKLIKELKKCAIAISKGEKSPKIIMIVGGAGNGKSDALENFLTTLFQDDTGNPTSEMSAGLKSVFASRNRRLCLDSVTQLSSNEHIKSLNIQVVQDATWGSIEDDEIDQKASELLAKDVVNVLNDPSSILLCCVNRGKLFQAANHLSKQDSNDLILSEIINEITKRTDVGPFLIQGGNVELYLSDRESLFQCEDSVFERVLKVLWDNEWDSHFEEKCIVDTNPIAFNKWFLENYSNDVGKILYQSEVSSKSRWTFRSVFSHLGIWLTVEQVDGIEWNWLRAWFDEHGRGRWPTSSSLKDLGAQKVVFIQLIRMLSTLPQLVFPIRNSLGSKVAEQVLTILNTKDRNELTEMKQVENLERLKYVIDFFKNIEVLESNEEVEDVGFQKFCIENDPAQGAIWDGNDNSQFRKTIRHIEDMFSQSITQGIEEFKSKLSPIELTGLDCLNDALNTLSILMEDVEDDTNRQAINRISSYLLRLSSNITKRAICLREGYVYNYSVWKEYEDILQIKQLPDDLKNELQKLLGEPKYPQQMIIKESDILSGVQGSSNYSFGYLAQIASLDTTIQDDGRLYIKLTRDSEDDEELYVDIPYTFSFHKYLFTNSRGGYIPEEDTTLKATIMELKTEIYKRARSNREKPFTKMFIVKDLDNPSNYFQYKSKDGCFKMKKSQK